MLHCPFVLWNTHLYFGKKTFTFVRLQQKKPTSRECIEKIRKQKKLFFIKTFFLVFNNRSFNVKYRHWKSVKRQKPQYYFGPKGPNNSRGFEEPILFTSPNWFRTKNLLWYANPWRQLLKKGPWAHTPSLSLWPP